MDLSEKRQVINKNLGDFLSKTSEGFMKLTSSVKSLEGSGESLKTIDSLFKNLMEFNRQISKEVNIIFDGYESLNGKIEKSDKERNRLERLYASGILFQSETEMKALMEKAIDTVVKELNADEGFIVLLNDNAEIEEIVAKNMDPDKNHSAKELSTTIINNSIKNLKPIQLNDISKEIEFSTKYSIISLGLTSAICVPLISGNKVYGAVYLDRRNKDEAFTDYDLTFLIAFSKQIVKGIEVSKEITGLEEKLIAKPQIEFKKLREQFASEDMIGTGKKLFNVLNIASKVSNTDASIFILGENGTGKELLARAIHANSSRSGKPFIAVNCGAIPADLLESELFGYESGAFTGAVKSKPGRMEMADGGTVFLDEIGEMSFNLQAKLLRVIQTKEIERLGGVGSRKIDVRFISATNKNITQMISEKEFREDLYYRLKVIEIIIPPLRERKEDVEELTKYFLKKYSSGEKEFEISEEALSILENYNWPGNIRELENVIQRGVILCKSNIINLDDLPPEIVDEKKSEIIGFEKSLNDAETEFRKLYILKILRNTNSKSEAAQVLGINRSHLHKLLTQLEIN